MKKFGLMICLIAVCVLTATGGWAKKKETENKFQAAQQKKKAAVLVEEEKEKKGKMKRIRSSVLCGYVDPMRIAGYVTNPPFGWVTTNPANFQNKYANNGFSYDLFTQLVKNANLKFTNIGYPSYQDALRDLRQGAVDVVVGSYYDRSVLGEGTNLMFPGYFTNPILTLFVKGKEKPVESWEDLRGMKGIVRQEEMIYSLIYNQIPKDLQIEQVSGSKAAFRKLLKGEADYMITSLYAGEAEVRRYKLIKEIYFSPKVLVSPELFFIFSSHTDCRKHKKKLSEELKKIMADKETYMRTLVSYIDDWGMRFKDEPSLIEEMQAEKERELHPELYTDSSDETDLIKEEKSTQNTSSDKADTSVSNTVNTPQ